jgi:hypothetical protein
MRTPINLEGLATDIKISGVLYTMVLAKITTFVYQSEKIRQIQKNRIKEALNTDTSNKFKTLTQLAFRYALLSVIFTLDIKDESNLPEAIKENDDLMLLYQSFYEAFKKYSGSEISKFYELPVTEQS